MPSNTTRRTTRTRPRSSTRSRKVNRNTRPRPNSVRKSSKTKSNSSFYFWAIATIVIIVAAVQITSNITYSNPESDQPIIPTTASVDGDHWWDSTYGYRRKLETKGSQSDKLIYTFDHNELVSLQKSLPDGGDLKVVAQVSDLADEVATQIYDPNTTESKIVIDTSSYPKATYYLYYGNKVPNSNSVLGAIKLSQEFADSITASAEQTPLISISKDKKWVIIEDGGATIDLDLRLSDKAKVSADSHTYYTLGSRPEELIEIPKYLESTKVSIEIDKLKSGPQTFSLVYKTDSDYYRSNAISFIASAPLYVALTVDWEGRNGEADWVLNELSKLSEQYEMPLTHFFNPRIYVSDTIPEYRANQLTQWVKTRHLKYGDEIALHMHMFYDMVIAAGINPIKSPRWGQGIDGYDVLASGYDYEQFTKLLNWSLLQFRAHGLPKPIGFRAGGWFADLEILKALNDAGFTYDSSGRENYTFGSLNAQGHWDLQPTTQPYYPSTTDQNIAGVTDSLRLLEIPNNGNDSYWFNAKQLKDRFYSNYKPGEFLEGPRIVTYLTHPDWFNTDKPKLNALLKEIDKYTYRNDLGPIVFTTLENTLPAWELR